MEQKSSLTKDSFEYFLACLNAEINVMLYPELRTDEKIDTLIKMAKYYIEKLDKSHSIVKKQERERITRLLDEEITEIDKDERFHYPLAQVQINAPLALIQVSMEARMRLLKKLKQALKGEEIENETRP